MKVKIISKDITITISPYDSLLDIELAIIDHGQEAAKAAASIINQKEDFECGASRCQKCWSCDNCRTQARYDHIDELLLRYGIIRKEML